MLGIEIMDAGLLLAMGIALIAGIFSFVSPCVLPIVPPYLAFVSGVSLSESSGGARSRVVLSSIYFVMGLSTVFIMLGFVASAFGAFFLSNQVLFGRIAGCVILLFGFHFLGLIQIPILNREARFNMKRGAGPFGAFVLGLAFAFGWVPCIGPQLGAILSLAAQENSVARGTTLLAVYALGLGVPFVLAATSINRLKNIIDRSKPHMRMIERSAGVLLVCVGLLLIFGRFSTISFWLLETFPFLALVG